MTNKKNRKKTAGTPSRVKAKNKSAPKRESAADRKWNEMYEKCKAAMERGEVL